MKRAVAYSVIWDPGNGLVHGMGRCGQDLDLVESRVGAVFVS